MNFSTAQQRQQIRLSVRKNRQNLTALQQKQAEKNITEQALTLVKAKHAKNIALYLPFDGEISTKLLINSLWEEKINVYLPVLHPFSKGHLIFIQYQSNTPMVKNKFGIEEPKLDVTKILPNNKLDIIFTPLVAFDQQGNRLGMGGGFYDRTLQGWQNKTFIPVGLAYACQEVKSLPTEFWDIPLYKILIG